MDKRIEAVLSFELSYCRQVCGKCLNPEASQLLYCISKCKKYLGEINIGMEKGQNWDLNNKSE